MSKHEPVIEELRPGVVEVKTLDGQSKKWFGMFLFYSEGDHVAEGISFTVSGGFATMHPQNELTINVVEAAPLEDFSPEVR